MSKPHFMIVESRFYEDIADYLIDGTIEALDAVEASYERFGVPGALEIPAAIALGAKSFKYDGYIALGCVIRGETSHYDIVAEQSARALMDLSTNEGLAIGNGILTCDTHDQAIKRADPAQKNKGKHAVAAAMALINLQKALS